MREEVAMKILGDVQSSYDEIAEDFSATRSGSWRETERFRSYVQPGDRLLDIGCGNGRAYQLFRDAAIEYEGVDVSPELINIARRLHPDILATFRVGSMLSLPYEDASFDVTTAVAVLHHIPSARLRRQALAEAYRVLKPGGWLLLTNWDLWQPKRLKWLGRNVAAKLLGRSSLDWNDAMIPWKRGVAVPVMRYYHGFTLGELNRLSRIAGFEIVSNVRSHDCRPGGDGNFVTVLRKPDGPAVAA